ncbi:MAG: hypothetical protein AAF657_01640 [Acidobacteriota bacterium]
MQTAPRLHNQAEIEQAAAELSPADLKRLQLVARTIVRYYGLATAVRDHEDLVAEALTRTLGGSRGWRKGIDFVYHLAQTMRSIAWTWFEQEAAQRTDAGSAERWDTAMLGTADSAAAAESLFDPEPDAEAACLAREQLAEIRRAFDDDNAASAILAGWAIGCKGPEIRQLHGLSPRAFQAAVRRIRRLAQSRSGQSGDRDES